MSNSVHDLRDTIVPKSDQLNAEQLLGAPITITVTDVRRGDTAEQPVVVNYEGDDGRPYKPGKSMRKVLIFAWGEDGSQWIGRSMTLFCDPTVKFGGVEVGGIRISHMSHIEGDIKLSLTATKGKKNQFIIKRLVMEDPMQRYRAALAEAAKLGTEALRTAWGALPKQAQKAIGGCPDDLKKQAAAVDAKKAPAPDPEPAPAAPEPAPQAPAAGGDDDDVF